MMWIFLSADETETIENSDRFSKANYGSRRDYSIETATLEKRLVFNHIMITMKKTIYNCKFRTLIIKQCF